MENTVDIREIERQQRWEAHAVDEGVKRYRRSIAEADLGDTPPGQRALYEMMRHLTPEIERLREQALDGIAAGGKGMKPQWWWVIGFLPSDKLAFITARTILITRKDQSALSKAASRAATVSRNIANNIKQEMEFHSWREAERKEAKATGKKNFFSILQDRVKTIDSRQFKRWQEKLDRIERFEWPEAMKAQVGACLLDAALRKGGGWFEVKTITLRGKTERLVVLSDAAKQAIADINSQLEVNRPYLLPMLCPPKPWKRTEDS